MKLKKWLLRIGLALLGLIVLLVAASGLINLALPTESTVADRLGDDEKAHLAEFFHVRQALGDAAWSGWGSTDTPVVLYNEAYAFLVGYPDPDPPPGWLKVPQDDPHGGPWQPVPGDTFQDEVYYRQPLPSSGETPQAFTVKIGDYWAASFQTKEWMEISLANQFRRDLPAFARPIFPYTLVTGIFLRGTDGYIAGLAHESFHAYQGTVAADRLAAAENSVLLAEASYPWSDDALIAAWQTELNLLAEALRAETDAQSAALAQQFLTQRAQRRQHAGLSSTFITYEKQREWLEGLARYVELEIWRQAYETDAYQPFPAVQDNGDFSNYETFPRRWSQEIDQIGRMADDTGDGRFYYSGMAQAVLLDRLAPGWKETAMQDDVFLEELLAAAIDR
ncbi:MAG: hypothetical protein ACOC9Z_09030 [Chloroflexota bacterium]